MTTNDVSIIPIALNKRPLSDKQRIRSRSPSVNKSRSEEFRLNRTMTAINRPSSKLPNARIKTSLYSSVLGKLSIGVLFIISMLFIGYRPPEQNPKLERQSTTVNANRRLPVVYSLMTEHDQRQMSEFRRRQVDFCRYLLPIYILVFRFMLSIIICVI